MLALVARRGRLLGSRGEAAAAQLLGDLLQDLHPSDSAAAGRWPPLRSSCLPPAAAGAAAGSSTGWPSPFLHARPFTATAASWLAAPPSSSSSSSDEQQLGDQAAGSGPDGSAAAGASSSRGADAAAPAAASGPQRIVTGTWLDRLPQSWVPYAQLMRIEKPIGTWLLAWPCFWSIALAEPSGSPPDLHLLTLFGLGAVLLRGAGCTVNDLWDRNLDAQVERTRSRPLAAGTVTVPQAVGEKAYWLVPPFFLVVGRAGAGRRWGAGVLVCFRTLLLIACCPCRIAPLHPLHLTHTPTHPHNHPHPTPPCTQPSWAPS